MDTSKRGEREYAITTFDLIFVAQQGPLFLGTRVEEYATMEIIFPLCGT